MLLVPLKVYLNQRLKKLCIAVYQSDAVAALAVFSQACFFFFLFTTGLNENKPECVYQAFGPVQGIAVTCVLLHALLHHMLPINVSAQCNAIHSK